MSNFEFVVFVSLLYSTSRISIRICRQNFRFVAQFDFSNFVALVDFSKSIVKFDFSKLEFSIRVFDSRHLNFEFVFSSRICRRNFRCLDLFDFSNFDLRFRFESFVDLAKFSKSHSSFEFLIELFNFRSQVQFDDCIND